MALLFCTIHPVAGQVVIADPPKVQLTFPEQQPIGAFRFAITGPAGVYAVYASADLITWNPSNLVRNPDKGVFFTDTTAHLQSIRFFQAQLQVAPTNMVFVPPSTFVMGAATNDFDSSANEHPQTSVLLNHGFWIGKYEVTQAEFLSIMGNTQASFQAT